MLRSFYNAGVNRRASCLFFAGAAAAALLAGCSGGGSPPGALPQGPARSGPDAANATPGAATQGMATGSRYPAAVLATHPIAYFPFERTSQGSVVGGYTTTFNGGATIVPGGPLPGSGANDSVKLTGSPQYVSTSLSGKIPGTGSMVTWVDLSALPSTANSFFYVSGESQSGNDFDLQFQTDNTLDFYTGSGEHTTYTPPASSLVGQWHMIAVTYVGGSNGSRNIYWDGKLVAPFSGAVNATPKSSQFNYGESTVFPGRYFEGNIARGSVYNRALTATEISTLYQAAGQPSPPSPTPMPSMTPTPMPSMSPTPMPSMSPTPMPSMSPTSLPVKIYVANNGNKTVTTYSANGTQTTPTITTALSGPYGLAVDAAGKIYVGFNLNNTVTTYTANGRQTTPTITTGLSNPGGVAVDAAGKIYVANYNANTVTAYSANGTQTTPTITTGLTNPVGVAVDAAGKIYVANYNANTVTTYSANGTQTTPTITTGLSNPVGVAVDAAGKIYVANANNTVTTYSANGTQTTPTITTGLNGVEGVAVDAAGKIYVANNGNNTVTTYSANGTQTTPTITTGLNAPRGVAVH